MRRFTSLAIALGLIGTACGGGAAPASAPASSAAAAKPASAAPAASSAAAKPAASVGASAGAKPAASAAASAATSGSAAVKPAAGKELVISGSLALTGNFADVGKNYQKTYQWYFDDLNKSGGLLGRPVKLVINDDESNPQKAAQLYDKYISVDKTDLLIGPYPTPILASVIPVVEREKMVLVQAGTAAASLLLGKNNKYTFTGFTFLDRDYAKGWTDWIKTLPAEQRPKTLAILTLNNPFTIGVQKGLQDLAKDAGMNVAVNEVYDSNTSDFTPLVQKAKTANADAVALLSYYPDSLQIAKTMAEQKLKPRTWYNAISSTVPTWTKDLGALGENTVSPVQTWATLKNGKGVNEALKFGKDEFKIDYIPLHVGAAMTVGQILTAGVQGCGKVDQDCIADWLRKNSVDTVSGNIKFDKDGFPEYWSILTQVQSGKLVAVYPSDVADGKMIYPQP